MQSPDNDRSRPWGKGRLPAPDRQDENDSQTSTERTIVNALLWLPGMAERLAGRLDLELFADPWCRSVVSTVLDLHRRDTGVDAASVYLQRVADGHNAPFAELIMSDIETPMSMAETLLESLVDRARRDRLNGALLSAAQGLTTARTVDAICRDLVKAVTE